MLQNIKKDLYALCLFHPTRHLLYVMFLLCLLLSFSSALEVISHPVHVSFSLIILPYVPQSDSPNSKDGAEGSNIAFSFRRISEDHLWFSFLIPELIRSAHRILKRSKAVPHTSIIYPLCSNSRRHSHSHPPFL